MKYFVLALALANTNAIKISYAESEGPTKPDFGEDDSQVVYRENDIVEAGAGVNKKFGGWHNPLADTDGGDDDESVLL